ncbi:MAG: hypothetical protein IIC67_04095 [Thaumarchaeota archaeon]|nr:hypothetical protein [Nitrososphaerota archaeon]
MTNWKTVTGKLSEKENEIIENFIAENNISKNELIIKALKLYIPLITGVNSFNNKDIPFTKDFHKGIDKIIKSEHYQRQTFELLIKLSKKYSPKEVEDFFLRLGIIETLQKELESSHAPKGRPKTKRARGRPKQ